MNEERVEINPNKIGEQKIWGNRFITNNNQVLFFKEWIDAGFIYVADLFKNGKFIQQHYLLEKLHSKSKWIVQYLSLKQSIPYSWKKCMTCGIGKTKILLALEEV